MAQDSLQDKIYLHGDCIYLDLWNRILSILYNSHHKGKPLILTKVHKVSLCCCDQKSPQISRSNEFYLSCTKIAVLQTPLSLSLTKEVAVGGSQ